MYGFSRRYFVPPEKEKWNSSHLGLRWGKYFWLWSQEKFPPIIHILFYVYFCLAISELLLVSVGGVKCLYVSCNKWLKKVLLFICCMPTTCSLHCSVNECLIPLYCIFVCVWPRCILLFKGMFLLLCRHHLAWAGGYHGDMAIQDDFKTTSCWVVFRENWGLLSFADRLHLIWPSLPSSKNN